MSELSVDAAALRLLRSQHGYCRVVQLYDVGMSRNQIADRVRKGIYSRCGHGIIALAPSSTTCAARAMLGVLVGGDGAVACRWTAAELHGVKAHRSTRVHVVRQGDHRRCTDPRVLLHRTRFLPPSHVTTVDAVPVTTLPRTLVDCATETDRWAALRMLDSASASASIWNAIHTTAELLSNGRAGVRAIADVTAPDGASRFRSVLERRAADALEAYGVPTGEWNVVIEDARGRVREVDLCFRAARLIVEFDRLRYHSRIDARQRDRATDRRLTLAGWRVIRFTWQDVVHRPEAMAREISMALTWA